MKKIINWVKSVLGINETIDLKEPITEEIPVTVLIEKVKKPKVKKVEPKKPIVKVVKVEPKKTTKKAVVKTTVKKKK